MLSIFSKKITGFLELQILKNLISHFCKPLQVTGTHFLDPDIQPSAWFRIFRSSFSKMGISSLNSRPGQPQKNHFNKCKVVKLCWSTSLNIHTRSQKNANIRNHTPVITSASLENQGPLEIQERTPRDASGFWAPKPSRKSASYNSEVSKSCSLENGDLESII